MADVTFLGAGAAPASPFRRIRPHPGPRCAHTERPASYAGIPDTSWYTCHADVLAESFQKTNR